MEENNKVKEQYNIEKENEKIINKEIEVIMQNSPSQKELMAFIQKVREYRTRIYDLKMQLKEKLIEAYSIKETIKFYPYKCEVNYDNQTMLNAYYGRKNELSQGVEYNGGSKKMKESHKRQRQTQYASVLDGESIIEQYYMGGAERYNILKITEIFEYYEKEIQFWQEMNLKKMLEIDEEEHYFE